MNWGAPTDWSRETDDGRYYLERHQHAWRCFYKGVKIGEYPDEQSAKAFCKEHEMEHPDLSIHPTKEAALDYVASTCDPGDTVHVCRGDWHTCPKRLESLAEEVPCPFCARVVFQEGMDGEDLLKLSQATKQ